jgi:hypothetical protein
MSSQQGEPGNAQGGQMIFRKILIAGLVMLAVSLPDLAPSQIPAAQAQVALPAAVGPEARDALARMGKTLSAKQFSYRARTFRSFVGPNGELLHIAHTTKTTYRRPDRLLVDVTGDDGSIQILYDGQSLVLYTLEAKQYVSLPVKGDVEKAFDLLQARTGTDYPLADLLDDNPEEAMTSGITSGGQVGTALIDGVRCRHFFFEQGTDDLDLQLWLEDNQRALPRRIVVIYRALPGRPIFIAELSDWDFSLDTPDTAFVFRPPAGVTEVALKPSGPSAAPK